MASKTASPPRLGWLDQYRGYTVLAMFVVNFVGSYAAMPAWLKHHHTYCSYADTIMPQFLFAVGFGYRLTFMRRLQQGSWWSAARHAITRNLGLLLIGLIVYKLGRGVATWAECTGPELWTALAAGFKRNFFQTLVHIGVTSLWVLPVIALGAWPRILFALGSVILHVFLSANGYYVWVNTSPVGIDGGPLGFLTWTVPLIVGSLCVDGLGSGKRQTLRLFAAAVLLMLVGYGISCVNRLTPPSPTPATWQDVLVEPPFVPPTQPVNMWTMSQRSGSASYLIFSAGFALLVALLFVWIEQLTKLSIGLFNTFGRNALLAYILHDLIADVVKSYTPRDAPLWYVGCSLGVYLLINWVMLRHLEKQNLFLRL